MIRALAFALGFIWILDFQNIVSPFRRTARLAERPSDDYTILVPAYGQPEYLGNLAQLEPLKERVLLILGVQTTAMAVMAHRLRQAGWWVHEVRGRHNETVVNLLRHGIELVTTGYAIRLDGDTRCDLDPGYAVASLAKAKGDMCSVKVLPTRRQKLVEILQGIEYDMSMLSRRFRPWFMSGAFILGTTDAWKHVLSKHSGWFLGDDTELGMIAKRDGLKVIHVPDFVAHTRVPETWGSLFRQRARWWAGNFRQTVVCADFQWTYPFWLDYNAGLVWTLYAGKILSTDSSLELIPTIILIRTGLLFVANWQVRSPWMIAFPYYSFLQVMVGPPLGLVKYVRLAWQWRTVGRYRFSHFPMRMRQTSPIRLAFMAAWISSGAITIVASAMAGWR